MHWFLPVWTAILLCVGYNCRHMPLSSATGYVIIGLIIWSLTEYIAHRFVFHMNLRSRPGRQFIFLIHGNHHKDPTDYLRNMMPLVVTLPLALLIWGLSIHLIGKNGPAFFFGFVLGYVLYDFIHYASHQYKFPNLLFRKLKQHHLRHHHIAEHCNYAVTVILWDSVFGTRAPRHKR